MRSLLVSQRVLGTEEIVLIHHTGCGMSTLRQEELEREIQEEKGVRPPFSLGGFDDLEGSIRESVVRIRAAQYLPSRDKVRGFIYDVDTGRLEEVQAISE